MLSHRFALVFIALLLFPGLLVTGNANASRYVYSGVIDFCDLTLCPPEYPSVFDIGSTLTVRFEIDPAATSPFGQSDILTAEFELLNPALPLGESNPVVLLAGDGDWDVSPQTWLAAGLDGELTSGDLVFDSSTGGVLALPPDTGFTFAVESGESQVCLAFSLYPSCYEGNAQFGVGKVLGASGDFVLDTGIEVVNNAASGAGSLAQAIADSADGWGVILFAPALDGETITLAGTQLLIDKSLVIDATGLPAGLTVSGGGLSRVFELAATHTLELHGLTITRGNDVSGGAIYNAGTLSMFDSALVSNTASAQGGGLFNVGTATLVNSTLVANTAESYGGGISVGGAGSLTLIHTTVAHNSGSEGGGIDVEGSSLSLENSVVALNTSASGGPDINLFSGTLSPTGANLIGVNTTIDTVFLFGPLAGNIANPLDPMLLPLRRYGSATSSKPPLPGSPAIDAAISTANDPAFDQTGVARPVGAANDLGAVETKGSDSDLDGTLDSLDGDSDNDSIPDNTELLVGRDPLSTDWQLTSGYDHNCVRSDSGIQCWGDNGFGKAEPPGLTNPRDVSAGLSHTCAIDNDGVKCWGDNFWGQALALKADLSNPRRVVADGLNTCALDDNGVRCWGVSSFGKLDVPVVSKPRDLSMGLNHSCVLTDTAVLCWGLDTDGQSSVPTLFQPLAVSAGGSHTCAVDVSGVQCWGDNSFDQRTVPLDLKNPWSVATGTSHTCAIDDTGVRCWGQNDEGQSNVPALSNPVAISLGDKHSCALDDTGVVCWGQGDDGKTTTPILLAFDKDLDGTLDRLDALPLNPGEFLDTDGDGVGNNADPDDDNDSVLDGDDAFPLISITGFLDTDSDGAPNDCDADCAAAGMSADIDDDNDDFLDSFEIQYSGPPYLLDPLVDTGARPSDDGDNDGVSLFQEITSGTFDNDFDSDGDGITDGFEINELGSNPADFFSGFDQFQPLEGDVNDDGDVNVSDLLRLQRIILRED